MIEIQLQTQQITSMPLRTTMSNFAGISAAATAVAAHVAAEDLDGSELGVTDGALVRLVIITGSFIRSGSKGLEMVLLNRCC